MNGSDKTTTTKEPWHQSIWSLVIAILCVGPLAIPLIWVNKKLSNGVKIWVTLGVVILTVVLVMAGDRLLRQLYAQWAELKDLYGI